MFRMINPIREYAWGSQTAFSELFGWEVPQGPQAELWMGAHASAPSSVVLSEGEDESVAPLGSLMDDGEPFPFLLKVLAADRPLSLQAHPGRVHAEQGYSAETEAGIAADSPLRNYHDPHSKPELIVAVTEFIALCGFRPIQGILEDLQALSGVVEHWAGSKTPAVAAVLSRLGELIEAGDYRGAAEYILRDAEGQVGLAATLVNEVVVESALAPSPTPAPAESREQAPPELPDGLRDTLLRVSHYFPQDPSLFVVMLLNRVVLRPGEALYLPPGQLHAYLQGT
ncbi:MAG TPA: mannose-6-phosphate isomerase, class I, partial [Candidatus Nesterenkonia stercoripullorum]|nr:mannose-6-phosphate isomerase, class I [Candidatus Nesterenkonia stercoripullorum]